MLEYLNALKQEWPTVKAAPRSFIICFIVGIIIGGGAILFLYSYFVLPGKDAQISLLQTLTDGQKQNSSDAKTDTKQDIRTFLESISPQILVKINAKEKKIGAWLGPINEGKLLTLAERAEFKNFLSFKKGSNVWTVTGAGTGGEEHYGLIRGVRESGTLVDYYLYPKDALIK